MTIFSIRERFGRSRRGWLAFCGVATFGAGTTLFGATAALADGIPGFTSQPASGSQRTSGASSAFDHHGSSFRLVRPASVQTAADNDTSRVMQAAGLADSSLLARESAVVPVGHIGGCSSCGTSGCGGGCGVGGHAGFGGGAFGGGAFGGYGTGYDSGFSMSCGEPCEPYRYGSIEGLYMKRDGDERRTLSPDFALDEFEYEWAPRVTLGIVPDCAHGYETSFTGVLEWDLGASATSAGVIDTFLTPGLPLVAADLSAFSNADFQSQTYSAEFWSFEASRTLIGWQMAKVLYGFRYISYEEEFNYLSVNNVSEVGLLQNAIENQLFGAQIGLDLMYPISCHGYVDFRGRAGVFLNLAENDTRVFNAGQTVVANLDEDEEIAGFFEIGSGVRYQLGEMLSVRGGVEMWYLTGVATAPAQLQALVTPNLGREIEMDEDIFFFGLTAGAELKF